jgi:DNA-binding MarR family transcriptional regulator
MAEPFVPLDPDAQLGYLVVRVADRMSRSWHAALRAHGINPRQFSVLGLLARDPDLSQAELARRVLVTPQSMSESLVGLLRAGLVERDEAGSGQPARVRLTEAGRELLRRAYPVVEATDRVGFGALNTDERADLGRLLRKLMPPDGRA